MLLDDALPPLSHPCRALHAVQSGRCADLLFVCAPLRLAVWFWLFAGQGAEEEGCKRSRGGLHFEAIEIATSEDKMLKEKELSNIGCTYRGAFQTDVLASYPAVCDST